MGQRPDSSVYFVYCEVKMNIFNKLGWFSSKKKRYISGGLVFWLLRLQISTSWFWDWWLIIRWGSISWSEYAALLFSGCCCRLFCIYYATFGVKQIWGAAAGLEDKCGHVYGLYGFMDRTFIKDADYLAHGATTNDINSIQMLRRRRQLLTGRLISHWWNNDDSNMIIFTDFRLTVIALCPSSTFLAFRPGN